MGIGSIIFSALVIGAFVATVIYITYLTIKKLKQFISERKIKSKSVAFGETHKILEENAKDILENSPSMTLEDLEEFCDETPYFVVDYDPDSDETSDYVNIKTDEVDQKVDKLMHDNDGILLFN